MLSRDQTLTANRLILTDDRVADKPSLNSHIRLSRIQDVVAALLKLSMDLVRLCFVAICIIANAFAQTIPFTQMPMKLNLGDPALLLISVVDQTLIVMNTTSAQKATFQGLSANGTLLFRTDLEITLDENFSHHYSNDSVCFMGMNSPSGGSPFTIQLACCSSTECALGPTYTVTSALSTTNPTYKAALYSNSEGYTFASYATIDTEAHTTVAELTIASSSSGLNVFDTTVKMNFTTPVISGGFETFYVFVTDNGLAIIVAYDLGSNNLHFSDQLDINSLSTAALSNGLANMFTLSECTNSVNHLYGGLAHSSMGFYIFIDCLGSSTSTFVLRWPLGSPFSELTAATRIVLPSSGFQPSSHTYVLQRSTLPSFVISAIAHNWRGRTSSDQHELDYGSGSEYDRV